MKFSRYHKYIMSGLTCLLASLSFVFSDECDDSFLQALKVVDSDKANAYKLFTDALNSSTSAWPKRAECLYQRGRLQLDANNPDAAMFDFTMAIQADPKHVKAHKYAGIALFSIQNMTLSLQELDFAEKLGKEDPEIKFYRGLIYLRLHHEGGQLLQANMVNAAIKEFDAAIKLKKNYPEVYLYKALAFKIIGDLKESVAQLNLAIKFKEDYIPAYRELATTYTDMNDNENAMKTYLKVIEVNPKIFQPYERVISLCEVLKKPEIIKKILKTALVHFSENAFIIEKAKEYNVSADIVATKHANTKDPRNSKNISDKNVTTDSKNNALPNGVSPTKMAPLPEKSTETESAFDAPQNSDLSKNDTTEKKTLTTQPATGSLSSGTFSSEDPITNEFSTEPNTFPKSNWY